jgi:hypothetical protein
MPPKKRKIDKAKKGKKRPAKHIEPSLLLSRARGEVANDLRPSNGAVESSNVEQNIREIRAIITTNAEILDRCIGSRKGNSYSTFLRYSFDVVEIRTIGSTTRFVAYPERSEKSFDMTPLTELPACIANIFVPPKKFFDNFIDYEAFFEKSLILHDEVLGAFLLQLKDHLLSSVQVCLGKIETWLMESESNINYLESKFGVKMEFPERCIILKEWTTTLPGTINLQFNISEENDRKKLEKVLELMELE